MEKELFSALDNQNIEEIHALLTRGAEINCRDSNGETLLHRAVRYANPELFKFLIDNGIDVNLKRDDGKTALNLATYFYCIQLKPRQCEIIKILVIAGADVNKSEFIRTKSALHAAFRTWDVDFARLLISRGAKVTVKNGVCSPLHSAAKSFTSGDPKMFEILLSGGADVNAPDGFGETALFPLARNRKLTLEPIDRIGKIFAKYGADFNREARRLGMTPMDEAIRHFNLPAVKLLVIYGGVDVNSIYQKNYRMTNTSIFSIACAKNQNSIAKFLFENGADINHLDKENFSPLLRHIYGLPDEYINPGWMLVPFQENTTPDDNLVDFLLEHGADVNTITANGDNLLSVRPDLRDFMWQPILIHCAKLQANNRPVHPSILDSISRISKYEDFFAELQFLKSTKLHTDYWVTLWDILVDDEKKLFHYAGSKNLALESLADNPKLLDKFTVYGSSIHKKLSKAVKRRKIWNEAATVLSDLLPITIDPDHRVIAIILNYFQPEDLQKLCEQLEAEFQVSS